MKKHIVKILDNFFVTHDVKSFIVERPENYNFKPGQATEVAINKQGWEEESRPFTFTNLPNDDFLQFIIKTYPDRNGVTNEMLLLKDGDELSLHEVFGAIQYKGKGTFIAGGAGITPFISILRHLKSQNKLVGNRLIFANKTKDDIILKKEFEGLLGKQFINILSEEKAEGYHHGMINGDFLEKNLTGHTGKFYVCGPPPMMDAVLEQLSPLGIPESSIIKEEM
jgi:ferredoxin-NADP reductase